MVRWDDVWDRFTNERLLELAEHPSAWQVGLADAIRESCSGGRALEAGCGTGIVSLLLGDHFDCTLLDVNARALNAARVIFESRGGSAIFLEADLFAIPIDDGFFDVVFNAGVLEHFGAEDRSAALSELYRVTVPGGRVVVAIPNHASWPYRLAYVLLRARGSWPYPDELRLTDLRAEFRAAGLTDVQRLTIDPETSFRFLGRVSKRLARLAERSRLRDMAEGYLAVYSGTRP